MQQQIVNLRFGNMSHDIKYELPLQNNLNKKSKL